MMDSATHSVRSTEICVLGSGVGRLGGAESESSLSLLRKGVSSSRSTSSSSNAVRDMGGGVTTTNTVIKGPVVACSEATPLNRWKSPVPT
jgi:hypothetical protein